MHMRNRLPTRAAAAAAVLLALAVAGPASAAQKTGCGNNSSGWNLITVADAAAAMWPTLLDPSIFGSEAGLAEAIAGEDDNGDDAVCMKQIWGDHLNPNSNWYIIGVDAIGSPTVASTIHDNNSNGS